MSTSSTLRPLTLYSWVLLALLLRCIAALTHSSWFHPDEWFQTVELAQYLTQGIAYHSQEFGLHLRNLFWPSILSIPLRLAEWASPGDVSLRLDFLELFVAVFNCLGVWGFGRTLQSEIEQSHLPSRFFNWGMALFVLPWFTIYEAVSPRIESAASTWIWLALGLCTINPTIEKPKLARAAWALSGFCAAAAVATRYPSVLFALPLVLILFFCPLLRPRFRFFALGAFGGVLLCGLPDLMVYGRAWESFWMYLQYNLFTGLSAEVFGAQPLSVYWEHLHWHWLRYSLLVPWGALILSLMLSGWGRGLYTLRPWAIIASVYALGHALIGHKEPRFIQPLDGFLVLAVLTAAQFITERIAAKAHFGFLVRWIPRFFVLGFLIQSPFLLKAIWGETWTASGTYREITRHLNETENVCAIMSVKHPLGSLLPLSEHRVPDPAMGYLQMSRDRNPNTLTKEIGLGWIERKPECKDSDQVLIHLYAPPEGWSPENARFPCTLLRSGVLGVVPTQHWATLIKKNWVRGPWYSCKSRVLIEFDGKLSHYLTVGIKPFNSLPAWGISGADLQALGESSSPAPASIFIPR